MIFAIIQTFNIVIAILLAVLKIKCCCRWGVNNYSRTAVSSGSLNFIHGVFFEVLICISCSMLMIKYEEYFNDSDKVSFALQFIFCAILAFYVLFVIYFTVFKTQDYVVKNKGQQAKNS